VASRCFRDRAMRLLQHLYREGTDSINIKRLIREPEIGKRHGNLQSLRGPN
jgi:hypothetical protein